MLTLLSALSIASCKGQAHVCSWDQECRVNLWGRGSCVMHTMHYILDRLGMHLLSAGHSSLAALDQTSIQSGLLQ